jgi:tubulin polyglutamylase TTLL2
MIKYLYIVLESGKQDVGSGCKWTLAQLRTYFDKNKLPFDKIWTKIKTMTILTLLPVSREVKSHNPGCFELYGFDILIDQDLKPWLLEVNLSPALTIETQVDIDVKRPLLEDMIDLIGLNEFDGERALLDLEIPITRRKPKISESKPNVRKSAIRVDYPQKVGRYNRIFPTDTLKLSIIQPPKVAEMKILIQEIKKEELL